MHGMGICRKKVYADDVWPDNQFDKLVLQCVVFQLRERPTDELWPMQFGQACFGGQEVDDDFAHFWKHRQFIRGG